VNKMDKWSEDETGEKNYGVERNVCMFNDKINVSRKESMLFKDSMQERENCLV
jgi:hypothetical protein